MTDLPTLPKAAYSLDLNDGHPAVAYSVQQMYDFARAALAEQTSYAEAEAYARGRDDEARKHAAQPTPMTADEIEQAIYAKTRRFVDGDVTEAIRELILAAALAREQEAQPAAQEPSDEQIVDLACRTLTRWEQDPIKFARAVLALRAQPAAQEPGASEREEDDTALIDWLERFGTDRFSKNTTTRHPHEVWFDCSTDGSDYSPTLRDAIRSAIKSLDARRLGREKGPK